MSTEEERYAELAKLIMDKNTKIMTMENEIGKLREEIENLKTKPERKEAYKCENCGKKFTKEEFKTQNVCSNCGSDTAIKLSD